MDHLFKISFFIFAILISSLPVSAYNYEGVLTSEVSKPLDQDRKHKLRSQIEDHVRQVMINLTIKKIGDVIDRTTRNTPARLLPDFAYLAAQQGALQCYKQEATLEIIRDVYDGVVDMAVDELENGGNSASTQRHISDQVEDELEDLVDEPVFREIVQKVIEYSWKNQQMYMQQQMLQQGLKNMAEQKQQVQEAIQQEYSKSIGSLLVK